MKRCILLLIGILFISYLANAQYKINKTKYDYRTYSYQVGDPYNPSVAYRVSGRIPGIGQMRSGEGGRGAAFLAGSIGIDIVFSAGVLWLISNCLDDIKSNFIPKFMAIGGGIGIIAIRVWSSEDAARVAKVNNLAFRDKNETSYNLKIQPYINTTYYAKTGSIPAGITLKASF